MDRPTVTTTVEFRNDWMVRVGKRWSRGGIEQIGKNGYLKPAVSGSAVGMDPARQENYQEREGETEHDMGTIIHKNKGVQSSG